MKNGLPVQGSRGAICPHYDAQARGRSGNEWQSEQMR